MVDGHGPQNEARDCGQSRVFRGKYVIYIDMQIRLLYQLNAFLLKCTVSVPNYYIESFIIVSLGERNARIPIMHEEVV
jgi:hypothetical protein